MAKSLWKGGKEYLIYGKEETISGAAPLRFSDRHSALTFLRGLSPGNTWRTTLRDFFGGGDVSQASDQQLLDQLASRLVSGAIRVVEKSSWKPVKRVARQKISEVPPGPPVKKPAPDAPPPAAPKLQPRSVTNKGPEEKPKLISIDFLNGDDNTLLKANGLQIVNLPPKSVYVGTPAANVDRLGSKLSFKATFDKPGSVKFKVKVVPGGGNAQYTAGEKKGNPNFVYSVKKPKGYTNKGSTSVVLKGQIFVAAAGSDSYTLQAEDQWGNRASSQRIYTQRVVYYMDLKMSGVLVLADNAKVEQEFKKYGIRLVYLGSRDMEHMKNIDSDRNKDKLSFLKKAKKAYFEAKLRPKEPHVMVVSWVDCCAAKSKSKLIEKTYRIDPASSPIRIPVEVGGERRLLWGGISQSDTSWLVKATYETRVKGRRKKRINIKSKCQASGIFVKVDVSGLPKGVGTFKLKVNIVDSWAGGLAFTGYNMICVATRSNYKNIRGSQQTATLVHEMGHQVGLVPDGGKKKLARGKYLYKGKGHQGPHCFYGCDDKQTDYDDPVQVKKARCVMFGKTTRYSDFCADCKKAARKVDLSKGWTRFWK